MLSDLQQMFLDNTGIKFTLQTDSWWTELFYPRLFQTNTVFNSFHSNLIFEVKKQAINQTQLIFNPGWMVGGFRKSDSTADEQFVLILYQLQAHLHVSEVEEVVHVSRGCILVIGDKNLWGEKKKKKKRYSWLERELICVKLEET